MKIVFSGFESPIEVSDEYIRTIEIENKTLFTRLCTALLSCKGGLAAEPYSLWDDDECEIVPSSAFLTVSDPLSLPWDSKDLGGVLFERMSALALENEEARSQIERLDNEMNSRLLDLTHQINGDYTFGVEWNLQRYLKAFCFSVSRPEGATFLETLNMFIDFSADMSLQKALLFINLKEFLSSVEFKLFLERVYFHKLSVVLLESTLDGVNYPLERKTLIDRDFLETC